MVQLTLRGSTNRASVRAPVRAPQRAVQSRVPERQPARALAARAPARKQRASAPPVTEGLKPIRDKMSATERFDWIAEYVGLPEEEFTNQGELIDWIIDQVNLESVGRREVKAVLDAFKLTQGATSKQAKAYMEAYKAMILSSLMPKGLGEFTEPGFFTFFSKMKPKRIQEAIKPGTMVRNPRTGEEMEHAGRPRKLIPAKMVCKGRPMRKLKAAVAGE